MLKPTQPGQFRYKPQPRRLAPTPQRSPKPYRMLALALVILSVLAGYFLLPARTISKVGQAGGLLLPAVFGKPSNDREMQTSKQAVEAVIAANPSLQIGVSVRDIKYGTSFDAGLQQTFTAASTTKLLSAATYLRQVEVGKVTLDQTYVGYPAKWHLQQMVSRSNNDSLAVINNVIGYGEIAGFAKTAGLVSYDYTNNSIAPSDMAILLDKIYSGKLLSAQNTALLLGYMAQTNNEDMIPAALPASFSVYHKYGHLEGWLHDVGIIVQGKHAVAIAVYTKAADNSNYSGRVEVIRQIVQAVSTKLYAD